MKRLAMGIDIGGTNTAFGLVDEVGDIYGESVISTEKYKYFSDYEDYIKSLCEAMHALIDSVSFECELIGIGIGAPNANFHTGDIVTPANLWHFAPTDDRTDDALRVFHIAKDIEANFPGVHVVITNDANAAAVGEMVYGGAKGMKDFLVVTLGTGLGSGFVANGQLIYGHDGFAGELGHVTVSHTGRVCGCGRKGCLETYVSATGIKRTIFKLMADSIADSEFRHITYNDLTAEMITKAALNGDPLAIEAYEYTGMLLGRALADAVSITSPEAIFLFGGLAKAGKYIFEPTKKYMEMHMMPIFRNKVKLLPSGIDGKNAAVLGASALAWQHMNEKK